MNTFKLSIRMYIYILIIILGTAFVVLIYNNNIGSRIFMIISYLIVFVILVDSILTKIIVAEDRLIYKQSFRTRYVLWKDVKALGYSRGVKDYQHTVWILTAEDISSFKWIKAICVRYTLKDYPILVKLIVDKCKDNPNIKISPEVLNVIR